MGDFVTRFKSGVSIKTLCEEAEPNPWEPQDEIRGYIATLEAENAELRTDLDYCTRFGRGRPKNAPNTLPALLIEGDTDER